MSYDSELNVVQCEPCIGFLIPLTGVSEFGTTWGFFPVVQINFQTILINNPDNPNFAKWNSKFLPYLSLHFNQTDLCYLKFGGESGECISKDPSEIYKNCCEE